MAVEAIESGLQGLLFLGNFDAKRVLGTCTRIRQRDVVGPSTRNAR